MKELNYLDITKTWKDEFDIIRQGHIKVPSATGIHPDMGVGTAQQIQTNIHESDSTPYVFRPTPYNSTRESGDIVGASVAWNQFARPNDAWYENHATMSYSDGVRTFTAAQQNGEIYHQIAGISQHKYLRLFDAKATTDNTPLKTTFYGAGVKNYTLSTSWRECATIWNNTYTSTTTRLYFIDTRASGWDAIYIRNVMFIDLTLALGSTIADYIYTLESGTEGAGVAKLREWGFCTSPYYTANAGGIESVNVSKHKMVGRNLIKFRSDMNWGTNNGITYEDAGNGEIYISGTASETSFLNITVAATGKDFFIGGQTYRFKLFNAPTGVALQVFFDGTGQYSANHTYTAPNTFSTAYMRIRIASGTAITGKVKISPMASIGTSDPEYYEPHEEHEYPLDPGLTLRGIFKLDGSNNLYADGDVYHSDGTVDRNWAERAYEAGDVSDGSTMITDGTTTVYKLQTPTTETADPYTEVQVCSPYGTEQFVDAGVAAGTRDVAIPVGHNTEYMKNIVGAIEGIPLPPTTNGNFKLRCTVASGVPTYSWVSE